MVGLVIFIFIWVWILRELRNCPLVDENENIIEDKNKHIKN